MSLSLLLALSVLLAFSFAMTNGFIDGGGLVSTIITTRTLEPLPALLLVAVAEIAGMCLLGTQVAETMSRQLLSFPAGASITGQTGVVLAAFLGALTWNLLMWRLAFPSSSSHSLIGAMAGAGVAFYGLQSVSWGIFLRLFVLLVAVPAAGVVLSFVLAKVVHNVGQRMTPLAGRLLRLLQIGTMTGMAMVHGSNDGQKAIGLLLLVLLVHTPTHTLPLWMMAVCGAALASGVLFGSRRTIRTLGKGLYRVQPLQGLCANFSAMALVGASSFGGVPMSTTHVMSTSVIGAGVAVHPRGVRWTLVMDIALAWAITVPAAAGVAAGWAYVLRGLHVVP